MQRALLILSFLGVTLPLTAQTQVQIPAVCVHLPAPNAKQQASLNTVHQILEKVVAKDALDLEGIRKSTQKEVDHSPNDPFLIGVLGDIEFRSGDLEAAIYNLNRSMQIFPCIDYVQFTAAKYYALVGDQPAARQHIDFAYALSPNIPDIANEWRNIHTAPRGPGTQRAQQLQRRATPQAIANDVEPFGGPPDQDLLPPVTQTMVIDLHKVDFHYPDFDMGDGIVGHRSPISRGSAGREAFVSDTVLTRSTITLLINGKPMSLLLNLDDVGLNLIGTSAEKIGINGNRLAIVSVGFGDVRSDGVPATISNRPEGDRDSPTNWTDGSIGLYEFSRSLITLDVWNGKLTLAPLPQTPPLATQGWTNLYVVPNGHRLLVPVDIGSGAPRLFQLSLMAQTSSFAPDTAKHSPDVRDYVASPDHFGANVGSFATKDIRVKVDGKTLRFDAYIAKEPRFPDLGMGVDGTLGRDALHGVNLTFNYRDHLLKVN